MLEGWKQLVKDPAALVAFIQAQTISSPDPSHHPIFVELAEAHPSEWNLIEAIKVTVTSDRKQRLGAYLHLIPALAHVKGMTATELLDLLRHLRSVDEAYSWVIQTPLASLFSGSDLGQETLLRAISSEPSTAIGDVELVADLLCRAEGVNALPFLESLPAEANAAARVALLRGVWTLGDAAAMPVPPALAARLWPLAMMAKDNPDTEFLGWGIACRLMPLRDEARQLVTRASVEGPVVALNAIAQWLMVRPAERWPDESRLAIVRNMLGAGMTDASIRQQSDRLIAMLLHTAPAQGSMLELCESIFSTQAPINPATDFSNVLGALSSTRPLYSKALTRVLIAPSISLRSLQTLLQHGFQEPEAFVPEVSLLRAASPERRVRVVHRLLAETVSGPALCHFFFALGSDEELQPWGAEAFLHVFIDHIAQEFPATALDFLKTKAAASTPGTRIHSLVLQALQPIEQWQSVLMNLPRLSELVPSEDKQIAINRRVYREQRRMHREAREQSVFAKLTTPLLVAQGSKVISRSPTRPPAVIELKAVSHAFELPGSDASDPLARLTRRLKYAQGEQ